MSLRLVALCVDANDPLGLARFWAEALRWDVADEASETVRLEPTDGTRFRIDFVPVHEPKVGPNRLHLDLTSTSLDDQRESVTQLVELGAQHIDIGQRPEEGHVVLADPEGNEFCVIEPGNSFLAGCGRLGSITCDGTREVGYFWSAALGWPLVWDQDEETAIRAPDGTGPFITWGGPPLPPKLGKNRLHLEVAPLDRAEQRAEVDRLVSLGATHVDIGQGDVDWVVMADPDGNEFCVVRPAESAEWDARYCEHDKAMWSGRPNGRLAAEVADLTPGQALDVGCGEGADAIWLAQRGWTVTAIDISEVAVRRAEEAAQVADVAVGWVRGDALDTSFPARSFDLVSLQYPALPKAAGEPAVRSLLDAVRPGGLLLAVYHDLDDEHREHMKSKGIDPADYVGADDLVRLLGDDFTVELHAVAPRIDPPPGTPHVADVVVRARRR